MPLFKKQKTKPFKNAFDFLFFLIIVRIHFDFPLGNLATQDEGDVSSSKC